MSAPHPDPVLPRIDRRLFSLQFHLRNEEGSTACGGLDSGRASSYDRGALATALSSARHLQPVPIQITVYGKRHEGCAVTPASEPQKVQSRLPTAMPRTAHSAALLVMQVRPSSRNRVNVFQRFKL